MKSTQIVDPQLAARAFLRDHPQLQTVVDNPGRNSFVADVIDKLFRYGTLSPAQVESVTGAWQSERRRRGQRSRLTECPSGNLRVSGTIISAKIRYYGGRPHFTITVKDDRGFLVWMRDAPSCVRAIARYRYLQATSRPQRAVIGRRLHFSARITPSVKVAGFGFASRVGLTQLPA